MAAGNAAGLPTLDWTFGPVAFRTSMAHHWLNFGGELWDAQIVPFINASREGARIEGLQAARRATHARCVPLATRGLRPWLAAGTI
eukprot:4800227-Prymnesium_polylepis.1